MSDDMTLDDLTVVGIDGIRRSFDEHYDTMMCVEQDPTGAHHAILNQHARIEELEKACKEWSEVSQSNYQRAKAAEAKLAEAVKALDETRIVLAENEPHLLPVLAKVLATLEKLKVQDDE